MLVSTPDAASEEGPHGLRLSIGHSAAFQRENGFGVHVSDPQARGFDILGGLFQAPTRSLRSQETNVSSLVGAHWGHTRAAAEGTAHWVPSTGLSTGPAAGTFPGVGGGREPGGEAQRGL